MSARIQAGSLCYTRVRPLDATVLRRDRSNIVQDAKTTSREPAIRDDAT